LIPLELHETVLANYRFNFFSRWFYLTVKLRAFKIVMFVLLLDQRLIIRSKTFFAKSMFAISEHLHFEIWTVWIILFITDATSKFVYN